jgi:hypothetical protein
MPAPAAASINDCCPSSAVVGMHADHDRDPHGLGRRGVSQAQSSNSSLCCFAPNNHPYTSKVFERFFFRRLFRRRFFMLDRFFSGFSYRRSGFVLVVLLTILLLAILVTPPSCQKFAS